MVGYGVLGDLLIYVGSLFGKFAFPELQADVIGTDCCFDNVSLQFR